MSKSDDFAAFLGLSIILIVFSLSVLSQFSNHSIYTDEAYYSSMAKKVNENPSFLFSSEFSQYSPFTPIIFSSFFVHFAEPLLAVKISVLLFSILNIIIFFFIGKHIKDNVLGIIAAFFLASNYLFFLLSTRALIDTSFTCFLSFSFLCLLKVQSSRSLFWRILFGLSIIFVIYSKNVGILIIPILVIYWVISHFSRNDFTIYWIPFSILAAIPLYVSKLITDHAIFYITSYDNGSIWHSKIESVLGGSIFYYPLSAYTLLTFLLFPFFIFAVYYMIKNKDKVFRFPIIWILVFMACFSFFVAFKVPRYSIYFIAPCILLAAYGFYICCDFILQRSRFFYVLIVLFFTSLLIMSENSVMDAQGETYGFMLKETGLWLRENAPADVSILTSSRREMRLFSGFEYAEDKGTLYDIPLTRDDFESFISGKKDIVLVTDVYDFKQNSWLFPMTENLENDLKEKGFVKSKVFYYQGQPRVYVFVRHSDDPY